jgi:DNA-binding GntR family transcriptional regulator
MTMQRHEKRNASAGKVDDVSRAERVMSELRKALKDGVLVPGQRIREVEVAAWLGVSRTPVREALQRLTEAGLLEQTAQGLVVVTLGHTDLVELYLVREVLVGAAAGRAAQQASAAEIHHLRSILDAMVGEEDPSKLKAMNARFHQALYNMSHNAYLIKSLQGLSDAIALLPGTTLATPGSPRRPLDQHRAIVDAIERQDSQGAEAIAREHIRTSLQLRLRQMFEERRESWISADVPPTG